MNGKKLLAAGAVGAVGYSVVKRLRGQSQTDDAPRRMQVYPKRVYERMESRVLYESSTVEEMFPYLFHTPDVEVYGPNDYPAMAVLKELLDDVEPLGSWSDVEVGDYYRVTGEITISPDDDSDFYVSELETADGLVFSAFGSVENFESAVQDAVSSEDSYRERDVTAVVEVQSVGETPENNVHFHALLRDEE